MKTSFPRSTLALLAALACSSAQLRAADSPQYAFIKEIHIGGDARWDYLLADAKDRRLFVSHGTQVDVVDLDSYNLVGVISNTPGVHGIAVASELGRGFSSNGRENKVSIFDLKTLEPTSKVETGQNPDAIIYEPGQQEVYAFNGHGQSATVIDAKTGKVTATIPLAGKPEFAAADPQSGRVFVNLEDKSTIAVIDTKNHTVVATWPIAPGESASGMAIDLEQHRLFIGCENQLMEMVDTTSGKIVGSVPIGEGVDANSFDPGTGLAFASCGRSATTTIAHLDSPDKLTVVQDLKTQPGARTMTVDTKTHNIYLSDGERNVPGSFKVLVYGIQK